MKSFEKRAIDSMRREEKEDKLDGTDILIKMVIARDNFITLLSVIIIIFTVFTGHHFTVYNHQPVNQYEPAEVSGYSSEVGQTDSTPFIMASNKRVYDGAIANNCKDFGEKVWLMGKEYTVEDRMNRRYDCTHYDIWFESKDEALAFGRQQLIVQVLK